MVPGWQSVRQASFEWRQGTSAHILPTFLYGVGMAAVRALYAEPYLQESGKMEIGSGEFW